MVSETTQALFDELAAVMVDAGKLAAMRVWDRMLRQQYGPDDIEELVDDECDAFRLHLSEGSASEEDISLMVDAFRRATVLEGKQLALLFAADHEGSA